MGKAGFGGGQGFFFFAEGETDLGGAVVGVFVETGGGDSSNADVPDEIFGEGGVAGFGWILGLVEMEVGDVRQV